MQLRDEKKWVSGCFWEIRRPFMIFVGHEEHISKPVLQILGTFFRYYFSELSDAVFPCQEAYGGVYLARSGESKFMSTVETFWYCKMPLFHK